MKIHSTKYLTAGESSEDRPNWLKGSRQNNFGFWSRITLTPALSHRMGEGGSSPVGRRIQPLWKLRETGLAIPSPVGRERVTCLPRRLRRRQGVRGVLLATRRSCVTRFCSNPTSRRLKRRAMQSDRSADATTSVCRLQNHPPQNPRRSENT